MGSKVGAPKEREGCEMAVPIDARIEFVLHAPSTERIAFRTSLPGGTGNLPGALNRLGAMPGTQCMALTTSASI